MHIKKSSHLKSRKIMNTIIILNVIIIVSRVTFNLMFISLYDLKFQHECSLIII